MTNITPLIDVQNLTMAYGDFILQKKFDVQCEKKALSLLLWESQAVENPLYSDISLALSVLRQEIFTSPIKISGKVVRNPGYSECKNVACFINRELSGVP